MRSLRMGGLVVWPLLAAGLGGLPACDATTNGAAEAGVRVDTVDGVVHVATEGGGSWDPGAGWTVADSGVTLGAVDGPPEYVFGTVAGVVVDAEGRIWIADTQAYEVRVFDRDGALVRRIGREGEGPGEFRNLSGLALAPEGVGALDGTLGRVTVFDSDGAVVRSFRLHRAFMVHERGAAMAFDEAGRFYDRLQIATRPGIDSSAVVTYSAAGQAVDTALVGVIEPDMLMVTRNGRPYMSVPRPFSPRPALAFGPDGTIHFSRGDAYRVAVIAPSGDTLRVFARAFRPRGVTADERAAAMEGLEESFAHAGTRPEPGLALPETHPPVQALRVDRQGNVWVLTGVDAAPRRGMTWSIHDREGRYLGDVTTPVMNVMHIGEDQVAGVITDELGVARVTVLPIRR